MERRPGRWRARRRSAGPGDGRGEDAVRPEDRAAVEAALREGARREKGGDTVGAASCYVRADQLGSGEGASNLGALLFEHGDVAAAEAVLRRAARRHHPVGTFRLGFLLDETRRSDEAIATYRRAAVLGNVDAMNNLGYVLQQRRDLPAARAVYQLIVDDGTDKAAVREARRVLARLGSSSRPRAVPPPDFDPEASAVDSLLWVAGDSGDERVQRARTFVLAQLEPPLRGDLATVLERLDRDELDPAHLRAAPYLQALVAASGIDPITVRVAAVGAGRSLLDQRPDDPVALQAAVGAAVELAEALLARDRLQEAWDCADAAVPAGERWCQLDLRNPEAYLSMSRVMAVLAVAGMAVRSQPAAVVADPRRPGGPIAVESAYFFGMAAIRDAETVLVLDPGNVDARLHLGREAWRLGRYLEGRPRVPGDEDTDYARLVVDTLDGLAGLADFDGLDTDERNAEPLAWARRARSAAEGAS